MGRPPPIVVAVPWPPKFVSSASRCWPSDAAPPSVGPLFSALPPLEPPWPFVPKLPAVDGLVCKPPPPPVANVLMVLISGWGPSSCCCCLLLWYRLALGPALGIFRMPDWTTRRTWSPRAESDCETVGGPIGRVLDTEKPVSAERFTNSQQRISDF
jgi:hypothetical protein